MSPSSREGQGSGLPRATGVRLMVDIDANLDGLATLSSSTSSGANVAQVWHVSGLEPEDLSDPTIFSDGHVLEYEFSSRHDGRGSVGNREVGPDMNANDWDEGFVPSSTEESSQCSGVSIERDPFCMSGLEDRKCTTSEGSKSGTNLIGVSTICSTSPDQSTGPESSCTGLCKPKLNGSASAGYSSAKSKGKLGCCNPNSESGPSTSTDSSTSTSGGTNLALLKCNQSQVSTGSSVEGLGSLQISAIDDAAKSVATKDSSKGVTAQVASALAALKVDSIGGNSVGNGPETASDTGPDVSDSLSPSEQGDLAKEDALGEQGSGSKIREDGEKPVRAEQELEDYEDASKKGKSSKKKKNRGRRNKAKSEAGAVAAAFLEAQENAHVRQWTRITAEAASAQGEVEFGCICGTFKGGCHSTACPYPFTPSGSMVQRKIKEQYDDLVRSNVARTLTLAQVGRFTTCLVEAKSALQQNVCVPDQTQIQSKAEKARVFRMKPHDQVTTLRGTGWTGFANFKAGVHPKAVGVFLILIGA